MSGGKKSTIPAVYKHHMCPTSSKFLHRTCLCMLAKHAVGVHDIAAKLQAIAQTMDRLTPQHNSSGHTCGFDELPGCNGRFNGFECVTSLNEVIDGCVHLLLACQPVSPFLLKGDHRCWADDTCKLNSFPACRGPRANGM